MATRFVNRDRRKGWRYYRTISRVFLYFGIIAAVAAITELIFALPQHLGSWHLLTASFGVCVVSLICYAYFVNKIRK